MAKKKGKKKKERATGPKLGAQYQAAKLGVAVAAPPAWSLAIEKSTDSAITRVTGRDGNFAYAKGLGVSLADQWGSKKLGHAAALSRKSVTAWAPEILEIGDGAQRANLDPAQSVANANAAFNGYDIRDNSFLFQRVRRYGIVKYGLGVGRKIANKTRIAEPLKRALGMLGGSL